MQRFLILPMLLIALASSSAAAQKPPVSSPKPLHTLLISLDENGLHELIKDVASSDPNACKDFLVAMHQESGPPLLAKVIREFSAQPEMLKGFMNAVLKTVDLQTFSALIRDLSMNPEVVRTVTVNSILNLDDESLIDLMRITTRHPQALKIFSVELAPKDLAEFTKKTLEDRDAFIAIIEIIKKDQKRMKELAPGVDLAEISAKIISKLDKDYFRDLLLPPGGDENATIQGLSLSDGIIDVPGQEKILLSGVGKQIQKMLDNPGFILSFLWNIYFGDHSSQVALKFRRSLIDADTLDGTKDGVVMLRTLFTGNREAFDKLKSDWAALFEVARFRQFISDPDILLDPLMTFLNEHEAGVVADTLSPLMIRSVTIRPEISKIVVEELPAEVIGLLLENLVNELARAQKGREILKRLMVNMWRDIPAQSLQKSMLAILDKDPAALYELVLPSIQKLKPQHLSRITLEFAQYEGIFYTFIGTAVGTLKPAALPAISEALFQKPGEFYQFCLSVIKKLPASDQDAFLQRLSKNSQAQVVLAQFVYALSPENLRLIATKFNADPVRLRAMRQHFPLPLVSAVEKAYQGRTKPDKSPAR